MFILIFIVFGNKSTYIIPDSWKVIKLGDIIELIDGSRCRFVRLKRKRFEGIIDGEGYDIHINAFDKVVKRTNNQVNKDIEEMEEGDK